MCFYSVEKLKDLKSVAGGYPVRVKFYNRSPRTAVIQWVNLEGKLQKLKELSPRKTWTMDSFEGHYFVAHVREHEKDYLDLNYGWYYTPTRVRPDDVERIYITVRKFSVGHISSQPCRYPVDAEESPKTLLSRWPLL